MNAQELIHYIATAEKKTPVKLYIKEKTPIDYEGAKVFGAGDKVVFGEWGKLQPILESGEDPFTDSSRFSSKLSPRCVQVARSPRTIPTSEVFSAS